MNLDGRSVLVVAGVWIGVGLIGLSVWIVGPLGPAMVLLALVLLVVLGLPVVLAAYAMRGSRIYLSELMLTTAVATIPFGAALRFYNLREHDELLAAIIVGLVGAVFVFGGSAWGWATARRLNETRAWPRLRLLLSGWSFVAATLLFFGGLLGACFDGRFLLLAGAALPLGLPALHYGRTGATV